MTAWRACPLCAPTYGGVGRADCPFCAGVARIELHPTAVAEHGALVVARAVEMHAGRLVEYLPAGMARAAARRLVDAALIVAPTPETVSGVDSRHRTVIGRQASKLLAAVGLRPDPPRRLPAPSPRPVRDERRLRLVR